MLSQINTEYNNDKNKNLNKEILIKIKSKNWVQKQEEDTE